MIEISTPTQHIVQGIRATQGLGDAVARLLRDRDVDTPVKTFGLDQEFLPHGDREQILEDQGLTPQQLARVITEMVAHRMPELVPGSRA